MILTVIAWQRPEKLGLGKGFGAIDKVNWNIYILSIVLVLKAFSTQRFQDAQTLTQKTSIRPKM